MHGKRKEAVDEEAVDEEAVDEEAAADDQEEHSIHARAVVRDSFFKWPNAVVPYVMSTSLRESII